MTTRKGFTLIELLVVIAIIGILATLVVTQVAGAQVRARNSSAASDVTQMAKAIELYKNSDNASATGNAVSVAAAATTDATLAAAVPANNFDLIFSGTENFTSGSGAYGVDINKTPSSAYTYTYDTSGGAVARAADATCYVIMTNRAAVGGAAVNNYSVKNGGNADASQSC